MSKLKAWREEQRLTQEQAADRVGISSVAWGRYEAGRVPAPDVLQKIIVLTEGAVTADDWFEIPQQDVAEPERAYGT